MKFYDQDLPLFCEHCRQDSLHILEVEIFDKFEGENGDHYTIKNRDFFIDSDMTKNPSKKRNGLKIHFVCECGEKSELSIYQENATARIRLKTI